MRTRLAAASLALLLAAGCGAAPNSATDSEPGAAPPTASQGGASSESPSASPTDSMSPAASEAATSASPSPTEASPARLELPRGGTTVFPHYRLVGYAGLTGSPPLGRLGIGKLSERVKELEKRAQPYAEDREILPVMEVIATIVLSTAGSDGMYRARMSDEMVQHYLDEARANKALLLLNIQPGRARFLDEVKAYDKWLAEPDVGLALDPEWAMGPGQVPGRVFGRTTGTVLNQVAAHVSKIVVQNNLPEKVVVYHQLAPQIVRKESALKDHPGVALVKSVDGIGARVDKIGTYRRVNKTTPKFVHAGFKLFYVEDAEAGPLMTPRQVLAIKPKPDYVMYE